MTVERTVGISDEQFAQVGDEITVCYQTFGSADDPPLLLVMGLAGPMTWWPAQLCERLARAGFFVVRYDNRDTGRSSRAQGRVSRRQIVSAFLRGSRFTEPPPYSMADLAEDAFGLMDHLGLDAAHVCGMSMGGMIVQTMAVAHPERVRSMTSIMSTTGKRFVGWQHPSLFPMLLRGASNRDAYIAQSQTTWRMIGSPRYPTPREVLAARAAETYDRGVSRSGIMRQMAAVLTQPDRGPALATLDIPAAVIHGNADKMVHVSGGRETAARAPGAELTVIDGMGHDLPEPLWSQFVDIIVRTARRAGDLHDRS